MTMRTLWHWDTPGKVLRAYPIFNSLSQYVANAVPFVASTAPDTGRYAASVDDAISTKWVMFEGSTQPANWSLGIREYDLTNEFLLDKIQPLLMIAAFKADADFGTGANGLITRVIQTQNVVESDPILEDVAGVQVLKRFRRGTSTLLIPAKEVKQLGGDPLTDPATQLLVGYREEA